MLAVGECGPPLLGVRPQFQIPVLETSLELVSADELTPGDDVVLCIHSRTNTPPHPGDTIFMGNRFSLSTGKLGGFASPRPVGEGEIPYRGGRGRAVVLALLIHSYKQHATSTGPGVRHAPRLCESSRPA